MKQDPPDTGGGKSFQLCVQLREIYPIFDVNYG